MIEPKDLRIGNRVLFKSKERAIIEIYRMNVLLEKIDWGRNNWAEYVQIEAIPLSPEWLDKADFVKGLKHIPNSNSLYLSQRGIQQFVDGRWNLILKIEIKFLHQLQNIWKEITGQELTIKP